MSKTTAQADDDILELTEIMEVGESSSEKPSPSAAVSFARTDGQPSGADFGADLDALLDSLGSDVPAPAAARDPAPAPAPIADPTPTDHRVDPNEELTLPEVSDIDSLLEELGVPAADAPEPAPVPVSPVSASAAKTPIALDDLPDDLAAMIAESAPDAAPAEPTAAEELPAPGPLQEEPSPASVPVPAEAPLAGKAPDVESIDLNELDALLDDMLAAAPAADAVPAVSGDIRDPASAVLPRSGAEWPSRENAEAQAGAGLETRIEALERMVGAVQAEQGKALRTEQYAGDIVDLTARLERLEKAVAAVQAVQSEQPAEEPLAPDMDALAEKTCAALLAPGSAMMGTITQAVTAKILAVFETAQAQDTGQGSEDAAALRRLLDKSASAAAARVIREEIAALLQP